MDDTDEDGYDDAAFAAGADSVDITSDNQMSYDEEYAAGGSPALVVVAVVDTDEDGYDDAAHGGRRLGRHHQ